MFLFWWSTFKCTLTEPYIIWVFPPFFWLFLMSIFSFFLLCSGWVFLYYAVVDSWTFFIWFMTVFLSLTFAELTVVTLVCLLTKTLSSFKFKTDLFVLVYCCCWVLVKFQCSWELPKDLVRIQVLIKAFMLPPSKLHFWQVLGDDAFGPWTTFWAAKLKTL